MTATLALKSTLTDRYQTTVPDAVRRVLHLGKRDRINYSILPDGVVLLSRAESSSEDPALEKFLAFVAQDIESHPQKLSTIDSVWLNRVQSLVKGVEFDLDAPLSQDNE